MKKAGILIGAYLVASLLGALTGALLWADPFRAHTILGFMVIAPLFQFVSLITSFNTYSPAVVNVMPGILLLVVCGGAMIGAAIMYCRSNRKWAVLAFAVPVFVASLQGAELYYEAIAW